jgi:hypothetical protein
LRRPILILLVAALAAAAAPASGQAVRSRSADYLFAATPTDARALWVNPAGLALLTGASVMAEAAIDFPQDSSVRFAQWTLGFNSRGLSVGYQRDRFGEDPNTGTLRFGLALPFKRGSVGASFSLYHGAPDDTASHRGFDFGARYRPLEMIDLGLVVRNIGRPMPRLEKSPVTGVLGANLTFVPQHAALQLEAAAAERLEASGYDLGYRAGIILASGGSLPFSLLTSLELDSDFKLNSWVLGVVIGGKDSGSLIASGPTGSGVDTRLQRLSVTGVATRIFGN